jgi:tripartite-type tricarboxylate transporter receptor subunit TctC
MQWYGVMGPANMPVTIVKTLNDSLNQVIRMPEMREKMAIEAVDPIPMTPQEFGQFVVKDIERWRKLATDRGIQLDS